MKAPWIAGGAAKENCSIHGFVRRHPLIGEEPGGRKGVRQEKPSSCVTVAVVERLTCEPIHHWLEILRHNWERMEARGLP